MGIKIKWKVAPALPGYRAWPVALYEDGKHCARIQCADSYTPERAKSGDHRPLQLEIADHSWTPQYRSALFPQRYATLEEAKAGLLGILAEHPQLVPKPPVQCKYCGSETEMEATKLCDRCWELERRIYADTGLAVKILKAVLKEKEGCK